MSAFIFAVAAGTLVLSAGLTGYIRRHALRARWLDVPNERSSHAAPTPRGGGLAMVIAASAAFIVLGLTDRIDPGLGAALLGGGGAVALIGFLDDRRPRAAGLRFAVHLLAAAGALACIGGLPPLRVGAEVVDLGWLGHVLGTLAIAWTLNLFNFMDGIDGIAAGEAVFIAFGALVIAAAAGGLPPIGTAADSGAVTSAATDAATGASIGAVRPAALVFGAATLGFLAWNWPPAKIFMGDVGSGWLGFVIAVIAIAAGRESPAAPFVWLTLGGAFFADATVTLVRRVARGERASQAHRSHAYQWLARRWASHRRVTAWMLLADLAWSLPLGWLAAARPQFAAALCVLSLLPWVILVIAAGAGRAEARAANT